MVPTSPDPPDVGQSADDELEVYLGIDRLTDEFLGQLDGADPLDATEFAARHPDVEEVLLPVLRAVATLRRAPDPGGRLHAGDRVGRFTVVGKLGRGGMGTVYEASESGLERTVALKVLERAVAPPSFRARFRREARAAARLEHPAIVPVYGAGEDDRYLWYAMRRIDGSSLDVALRALQDGEDGAEAPLLRAGETAERDDSTSGSGALEAGPPPVGAGSPYQRAVARIGQKLAGALAYAHAEGVLHRDVKPGNVLLDPAGQPHLADFGLCRLEGDASLTGEGNLLGTLRYLSPETIHGEADERSDVYSLGLVLYELLARRAAVDATGRVSILHAVENAQLVPLRRCDPSVPEDLDRIVRKATAKLPDERYAGAAALASDLAAFLAGRPIQARPPGLVYLLRLLVRRHRAAVAVALVGLIALLGVGVAYVVQLRTLLGEVRAERERSRHGEAVATISQAALLLREGERGTAADLLSSVPEEERSWVWTAFAAVAERPFDARVLSMRQVAGASLRDDGTALVWGPLEAQIIDATSLRRHASRTPPMSGSELAESFRGAADLGGDRGVLLLDGRTRTLLSWAGTIRDAPRTVASFAGAPERLAARGDVGVAAVATDRAIAVLDAASGEVVHEVERPGGRQATSLAIAESGDVFVGTKSGEVWRIADGVPERVETHDAPVTALLTGGDGLVATADADGRVVFHSLPSRVPGPESARLARGVMTLVRSAPERAIAGLDDGTVVELDLERRVVRRSWPALQDAVAALVPHEGEVIAISVTGTELRVGTDSGALPAAVATGFGFPSRLAFSPDGARAAFTTRAGWLRVLGPSPLRIPAESRRATPTFRADGALLASGGLVLDALSGEEVLRWAPPEGEAFTSVWLGDELVIAVWASASRATLDVRTIDLWTWDSAEPAEPPTRGPRIADGVGTFRTPVVVAVPGARDVVAYTMSTPVERWSVDAGERVWTAGPHGPPFLAMALDAQRGEVVAVGSDRVLRRIDLATGAARDAGPSELASEVLRDKILIDLAIHPTSGVAVTIRDDLVVGLWTYPEGRRLAELDRFSSLVGFPTFTPDGRWLALSSNDGTVELVGAGPTPSWADGGPKGPGPLEVVEDATRLLRDDSSPPHALAAAFGVAGEVAARLEAPAVALPEDGPVAELLRAASGHVDVGMLAGSARWDDDYERQSLCRFGLVEHAWIERHLRQ